MNQRKMRADSTRAIADVDLHLRSPDTLVAELSGGQRQGVAIARAMYFKSKVLILDEPTNHLSVRETSKVLGFVKGLAAQNVTTILISHNLHHVFVSCERVVAMARGRIVLDKKIAETSIDEIVDVISGVTTRHANSSSSSLSANASDAISGTSRSAGPEGQPTPQGRIFVARPQMG